MEGNRACNLTDYIHAEMLDLTSPVAATPDMAWDTSTPSSGEPSSTPLQFDMSGNVLAGLGLVSGVAY